MDGWVDGRSCSVCLACGKGKTEWYIYIYIYMLASACLF